MSRKREKAPAPASARCAIYTRKSTEEGLEQEYNTLDAQRDAGEAYIKSQQHEGWVCLPTRYDDGGFTGANMDRPALRRLLVDIETGEVDCVVVYKVDRLSRSLLDFARIMETFDRHRVSFVSVTQAFNTATSMGRLILNVLLSFAQFEREMISERTRDKIAAARRKGKWSGGMPILGYNVAEKARGEPGRGQACSPDVPSVPGAPVAVGGRQGTQSPRLAQQALDHEEGLGPRRPGIRQGLVVPTADERRLCRQGAVQGRDPSGRTQIDRGTPRSSSAYRLSSCRTAGAVDEASATSTERFFGGCCGAKLATAG